MPRFTVSFYVHREVDVDIEAADVQAALQRAEEMAALNDYAISSISHGVGVWGVMGRCESCERHILSRDDYTSDDDGILVCKACDEADEEPPRKPAAPSTLPDLTF